MDTSFTAEDIRPLELTEMDAVSGGWAPVIALLAVLAFGGGVKCGYDAKKEQQQ